MTPERVKEKKEILIEVLSTLISEELDEAVAHEMSGEIEIFATSAVQLYAQDSYEDTEEEGLIEYRSNMDDFSSEE